jgi:predicted DNA-binding transcriptional regulator AlpA
MARRKLTVPEAAERAGCKPSTWRAYVNRGHAPRPDGRYDLRTPWWWESTVDAWKDARPGRGARTDLPK